MATLGKSLRIALPTIDGVVPALICPLLSSLNVISATPRVMADKLLAGLRSSEALRTIGQRVSGEGR